MQGIANVWALRLVMWFEPQCGCWLGRRYSGTYLNWSEAEDVILAGRMGRFFYMVEEELLRTRSCLLHIVIAIITNIFTDTNIHRQYPSPVSIASSTLPSCYELFRTRSAH